MKYLRELIKKVMNREVIMYVIFGVVTTLVNLISCKVFAYFGMQENIAKGLAIILSILVAYFTNRKWVFDSKAVTFSEKFREFGRFILSRSFTAVVEWVGFYLLNNILHISFDISNISITVLVVILNYFFGKFFAFKKGK